MISFWMAVGFEMIKSKKDGTGVYHHPSLILFSIYTARSMSAVYPEILACHEFPRGIWILTQKISGTTK